MCAVTRQLQLKYMSVIFLSDIPATREQHDNYMLAAHERHVMYLSLVALDRRRTQNRCCSGLSAVTPWSGRPMTERGALRPRLRAMIPPTARSLLMYVLFTIYDKLISYSMLLSIVINGLFLINAILLSRYNYILSLRIKVR